MAKKHKKIGLVGIFEDYQNRADGVMILSPGHEYASIKRQIVDAVGGQHLLVSHDAYYLYPATYLNAKQSLDAALCYLWTGLANVEYQNHRDSVLVPHTALDAYAEIVMYHNRKAWLEPLIAREVASYDVLILIPSILQDKPHTKKAEQYQAIISRLIKRFPGKFAGAHSFEKAVEMIREVTAD